MDPPVDPSPAPSRASSKSVLSRSAWLTVLHAAAAGVARAEEARYAASVAQQEARRVRGELFRTSLPRDPSCGSVARRLLETHLLQRLNGELLNAKTVTSELVNNAYLHGEGGIELRVALSGRRLRIEVIDQGDNSHLVAAHHAPSDSRGLAIVDQLAQRWGAYEGTTHVWAELLIPRAAVAQSG